MAGGLTIQGVVRRATSPGLVVFLVRMCKFPPFLGYLGHFASEGSRPVLGLALRQLGAVAGKLNPLHAPPKAPDFTLTRPGSNRRIHGSHLICTPPL
jgi:hypothetical protein